LYLRVAERLVLAQWVWLEKSAKAITPWGGATSKSFTGGCQIDKVSRAEHRFEVTSS